MLKPRAFKELHFTYVKVQMVITNTNPETETPYPTLP